uniref:Uncharacterized protein n=1 Tax=Caenorhabditis japonica TaxID=281687 RepID=A0A8R1EHI1_CAEJA
MKRHTVPRTDGKATTSTSDLNVRSIPDQSMAEAFDLLAVNIGCKATSFQEAKRKGGEGVIPSGAELILTRSSRTWTCLSDPQRLAENSSANEEGVGLYHHGDVRVSWIFPSLHQCLFTHFGGQRVLVG